jgi:uncharacterized membrane protein YbhN (UPF0104 family)
VAAASELLRDPQAYARMANGDRLTATATLPTESSARTELLRQDFAMRILKPLLKIAISLALITIVVHAFDVRGVIAHFAKVDLVTLLLVIVIALSITLLHTLRWLAVVNANGSRLGFKAALQIVLIGHFFNQALPSSVGGMPCAYGARTARDSALAPPPTP